MLGWPHSQCGRLREVSNLLTLQELKIQTLQFIAEWPSTPVCYLMTLHQVVSLQNHYSFVICVY